MNLADAREGRRRAHARGDDARASTSGGWTCTWCDRLAFTDRGERAEIETILADHRRQLTEYDKRLGETDPATMRNYYEQRRKEIEAAIERETRCWQRMPAAIAGSWFENRIIPLDATTPDQPGVAMLVDAYNKENVRRAAAGKPVGLGTEAPAASPPPPRPRPRAADVHRHRGVRRLPRARAGAVEDDQARARAVRAGAHRPRQGPVVRRLPRDRLPAARRAHGHRGRARALRQRRVRSCHGPGSKHGEAADKSGTLARAVPEATCRGCHTADVTNGEFDYKKFVQAIVGPGHVARPLAAGRSAGEL